MKLTNTYSSGSLHRRVRRMLILCIAIVVLLSTSVGLGIGLYQDVCARAISCCPTPLRWRPTRRS